MILLFNDIQPTAKYRKTHLTLSKVGAAFVYKHSLAIFIDETVLFCGR